MVNNDQNLKSVCCLSIYQEKSEGLLVNIFIPVFKFVYTLLNTFFSSFNPTLPKSFLLAIQTIDGPF